MTSHPPAPLFDGSFTHHWQAEILPSRPLILPSRHYVYPQQAEEVERGALEVLIRVNSSTQSDPKRPPSAQEFLATCALGFRDPAVPTGLWSCPNPDEICAVCGGYVYIIDTTTPDRFTMIPYRPVLEIRPVPVENLILFVGHHSILAWGANGQAWQSEKLSSEGLTLEDIDGPILHGLGWDLMTDKESRFAIDLQTGLRIQGPPF
ncbi:MAG: hypothetical protein WBQ94_26195 [Terracidiphilus sp.]